MGTAEGHPRVHEARFDGDDANAGAIKAVAQSWEVDSQSGFRGAVEVITLATTATGHRR